MISLGWALIQYGWWPYKKRTFGHRTHRGKMRWWHREKTAIYELRRAARNRSILFPHKLRVLIFTNSNLDQAQLKAQEEERRKREAEEKEAQLEKKREEKRLKKMVSSFYLVSHLSFEACCVPSCGPVHLPSGELRSRTLFSRLHPFSTLFNENLFIPQILAQHG